MMESAKRALRVLVVDDLRDSTDILCVLLETLGHHVRGATSAADALAIAAELHPHLVILDIGLPDLNGYDVARELRRRAGSRRLHLAAVTGWGTTHDHVRAIAAGFDQHFLKPADERTIRQICDAAIRTISTGTITIPEVRPS